MFFLILLTFLNSIFGDLFEVELTCTGDGLLVDIKQRDNEGRLTLKDIANGGYLRKDSEDKFRSNCIVTESNFNVANGSIQQYFPFECGNYNLADESYSTTLVYRLD